MKQNVRIQKLLVDLDNAKASLISSLEILSQTKKQGLPVEWYRVVEAGVIQNFEFSYELAIKLILASLVEKYGATKVETLSFKEILILAADYGIIEQPESWTEWRGLRNRSSHVYSPEVGVRIIEPLDRFLIDLSYCRDRCSRLNAA